MTGRCYLSVSTTTTTTTSHRYYTSVAVVAAVVVVGDCDEYGGAGQKICDGDSIVDVTMIVCCCELPLGHRDVLLARPKPRPEQHVDDTAPVEAAAAAAEAAVADLEQTVDESDIAPTPAVVADIYPVAASVVCDDEAVLPAEPHSQCSTRSCSCTGSSYRFDDRPSHHRTMFPDDWYCYCRVEGRIPPTRGC